MKRLCYPGMAVCLLIGAVLLCTCKKQEKGLPSLLTVIVSRATLDSAFLGGLIINDGGAEITARGVCYGNGTRPDISDSKTINGKGKGTFISILSSLTPNTLYFARAYATNSEGTGYGNEITFQTMQGVVSPLSVVTLMPVNSFYYSDVAGRVVTDGGLPVTEIGIFWSTGKNPTISGNNIIYPGTITGNNGTNYTCRCRIDSLQPDSFYYACAYAINSTDTAYGKIVTIKTLAVPEVSTTNATEITRNSVKAGGNVISLGDALSNPFGEMLAIEIGICYGTDKDPSLERLHIKSDATGEGEFTCNLTNLLPGILYHARSYVRWGYYWYNLDWDILSEVWVVYGNEITFLTAE